MEIANIIVWIISLTASILGIIQFFSGFMWKKLVIFSIVATCSILIGLLWNHTKNVQHQLEMKQQKEAILKQDAKIVSQSIIISGWEDAGDFVGYLSQIVGFLKRHNDKYDSEYQTYNRQLTEWQDNLKQQRSSGKTLYQMDWNDLRGIVRSGREQLVQIANTNKTP